MAAAQELLIDVFMAATAVPCRQLGRNHEAVVIFLLLSGGGLMAVQATHTFGSVQAHFIGVDYGILSAHMTLCAFSGSTNQLGAGLRRLNFGSGTIHQKCG